jgi:hypothetical protein
MTWGVFIEITKFCLVRRDIPHYLFNNNSSNSKDFMCHIWVFSILLLSALSAYSQTYVTPKCGTADDTPAVQAAIDSGMPVLLPVGQIRISSLNMTNRQGAVLRGCGNLATDIIPTQSGVNVIDLTGSSNTTLSDFHIAGASVSGIYPLTGILSAQAAGSYTSDVTMMDHIRVDGYFTLAAWFNLGVVSSAASMCQFYNYFPGSQVLVITGNNFFGAQSFFTALDQSNNFMPSDWTFTQVELHNLGGGWSLWIGGAQSIRFYGGNIASSHVPVSINAVISGSGAQINPADIVIIGTTFYNDAPPSPGSAISGNPGKALVVFGTYSPFPLF